MWTDRFFRFFPVRPSPRTYLWRTDKGDVDRAFDEEEETILRHLRGRRWCDLRSEDWEEITDFQGLALVSPKALAYFAPSALFWAYDQENGDPLSVIGSYYGSNGKCAEVREWMTQHQRQAVNRFRGRLKQKYPIDFQVIGGG